MSEKMQCSLESYTILQDALVKAAEDNNISHEEFIAFIVEFPRLLLGDKYDQIIYVPGRKP